MYDFFLNISTQNILRGYMFEPPRRGGCNECPQCTFWIKNNKIRYTPANPSFSIYKWDITYKRAYVTCTCFPDGRASHARKSYIN